MKNVLKSEHWDFQKNPCKRIENGILKTLKKYEKFRKVNKKEIKDWNFKFYRIKKEKCENVSIKIYAKNCEKVQPNSICFSI